MWAMHDTYSRAELFDFMKQFLNKFFFAEIHFDSATLRKWNEIHNNKKKPLPLE
jgi:hypothetical protein